MLSIGMLMSGFAEAGVPHGERVGAALPDNFSRGPSIFGPLR
jgi:hypothetical protein